MFHASYPHNRTNKKRLRNQIQRKIFGVLSMMMVSMGLVFPPVGLIAFVVSATAGVNLMKVYKGTSILMLSIVITTVLLMIFPTIVTWLPEKMR